MKGELKTTCNTTKWRKTKSHKTF